MPRPGNTIFESDWLHIKTAHEFAFQGLETPPEFFNPTLLRLFDETYSVGAGGYLIDSAVEISKLLSKYPSDSDIELGDRERLEKRMFFCYRLLCLLKNPYGTVIGHYKSKDSAIRDMGNHTNEKMMLDLENNFGKGGFRDILGRFTDDKRRVIFLEFGTLAALQANDANVIMELREYDLQNINPGAIIPTDIPKTSPIHPIVTSPNTDFIPPIALGQRSIIAKRNGGFGREDFTRNPQLFNVGCPHLPFGFRRPDPDDIRNHEWTHLWWEVERRYFQVVNALSPTEVGRLDRDIVGGLLDFLNRIVVKVQSFCDKTHGVDTARMRATCNVARSTGIRLYTVDLSYEDVVLQVALFQRQCWEILAWLNLFTIGIPRTSNILHTYDAYPLADLSLMGCIVRDVETCDQMARMTLPVWLLRAPWDIPSDTVIHRQLHDYAWPDYPDEFGPVGPPVSERLLIRSNSPVDWALAIQRVLPKGFNFGEQPVVTRLTFDELQFVKKDRQAREAYLALMASSASERVPNAGSYLSECSASLKQNVNPSTAGIPSGQFPRRGLRYKYDETPGTVHQHPLNFQVDANKFRCPESPLFPPPTAVWLSALTSVDYDTKRLKQNCLYPQAHGYMYPPLTLFAKEKRENVMMNFFIWLTVRSDWILRIEGVRSNSQTVPRPNDWNNFFNSLKKLFFPVTAIDNPESSEIVKKAERAQTSSLIEEHPADNRSMHKSGELVEGNPSELRASDQPPPKKRARLVSRGRLERSQQAASDVFELSNISRFTRPDIVSWGGVVYGHNPKELAARDDADYQRVIWDLAESLFRRELEVLDKSILPDVWRDEAAAADREAILFKVFPYGNGYTVNGIPSKCLTSDSDDDRAPFVEALRLVMASWDGTAAEELRGMSVGYYNTKGIFTYRPNALLDVEWRVTRLYCQTFYDFAGRAPTIPLRIPQGRE